MKESIDIFFNSNFIGIMDVPEVFTQVEISKAAQKFLPKRNLIIKKEIFIPHKSLSFIEKTDKL